MTANEARTLVRYTVWATKKVLEAARQLSPEDLQRANGISHESIAGTLSHIYWADRAWFERIDAPGGPMPKPSPWEETEREWLALLARWEKWADGLQDGDLDRELEYRSLLGGQAKSRIDHILMHVVNHATLHRGQVMGMIRQLGVQPPATDMIFYFREQAAATA